MGAGGQRAVGRRNRGHLPLEQLQDHIDVCRHPGLQPGHELRITHKTVHRVSLFPKKPTEVCRTTRVSLMSSTGAESGFIITCCQHRGKIDHNHENY